MVTSVELCGWFDKEEWTDELKDIIARQTRQTNDFVRQNQQRISKISFTFEDSGNASEDWIEPNFIIKPKKDSSVPKFIELVQATVERRWLNGMANEANSSIDVFIDIIDSVARDHGMQCCKLDTQLTLIGELENLLQANEDVSNRAKSLCKRLKEDSNEKDKKSKRQRALVREISNEDAPSEKGQSRGSSDIASPNLMVNYKENYFAHEKSSADQASSNLLNQNKKRTRELATKSGQKIAKDDDTSECRECIEMEEGHHVYAVEHWQDFSQELNYIGGSINHPGNSNSAQFCWEFKARNNSDLKKVVDKFREMISDIHIDYFTVPEPCDLDVVAESVRVENKSKKITFFLKRETRKFYIVGPKIELTQTMKWAKEIIDYNVSGMSSGGNDDQYPKYTANNNSYVGPVDQRANSPGSYPVTRQPSSRSGSKEKFIVTRDTKDKFVFYTGKMISVSIYQGNMVKQPTEVIVNPANDQLAHGGGLARVILDAGGSAIDQESRKIISKQGPVGVGEVVHTSAGKLPSPIHYVIHAVGPSAYAFKDNPSGLPPMLKKTFFNCLQYAASELRAASISIPPISAGIYAVPIKDIAKAAYDALKSFDNMLDGKSPREATLKEVHFVSNDPNATLEMIDHFRRLIETDGQNFQGTAV